MLSRLRDARVFTDSSDVVITDASARAARRRLLARDPQAVDAPFAAAAEGDDDLDESDGSEDGDEQSAFRASRHPPSDRLHPQHPYNAQLLRPPTAGKLLARRTRASVVYESRPMEFVFLPNGEIRPRDECPPGLALPPPAAVDEEEEEEEEEEDIDRSLRHQRHRRRLVTDGAPPVGQQQQRSQSRTAAAEVVNSRQVGARDDKRRSGRAPSRSRSRSSSSGEESESEVSLAPRYPPPPLQVPPTGTRRKSAASSSIISSSSESEPSDEEQSGSDDEEKENAHQQQRQQVTRKKPSPKLNTGAAAKKATAASSAHHATNKKDAALSEQPARRKQQPSHSDALADADRQPSRRLTPKANGQAKHPLASPSSASDDSRVEWSRRPKAVKYTTELQQQSRAASDQVRPKKAAKLDVRDLLSEHSRVRALRVRTPSARDQREAVEALEQELQREKQRVLAKMTQLLEEQSKNQQLQRQADAFEAQLAAKEREADEKAKAERESLGQLEAQWKARVSALEDQLRGQDAAVARLQSENEQLRTSLKERARRASAQPSERDSSANLQLEKIVSKLRKFRARVQSWKASSKEAMDVCDASADTMGLLETVWLDFPAFPLLELIGESVAGSSEKRSSDTANMVLFLKNRLRLREDELRRTHAKYVELKELCARQCVREADLQNFINEHRLRGNLVIRKDAGDARKSAVQFQEPPESRKKAGGSRATNTPAAYDDDVESDEEDDEEDDDDDDDDEQQQEDYYVRQPKVFVQVGRDGVYEHAPRSAVLRKLEEEHGRKAPREVERIRLVPSPTLARRFERVPAASDDRSAAAAARRKPSGVSTPTRATARLARAPPSISATRASSMATRRKTSQAPSAATRANGTRAASVSSRLSRAASAPWV